MKWNWDKFFLKISNQKRFIDCINNGTNYLEGNLKCIFSLKKDDLKNFHCNARSKKYYTLTLAKNIISIDKTYLLMFFDDYLKKGRILKINPSLKFEYFDFEFMLNLALSGDALSGLGIHRRMLQSLIDTVEKTPISIRGNPVIYNTVALEEFLQKHLVGFVSFDYAGSAPY